MAKELDIFETPVTVTPQQEISKTLKFFQNSLDLLNVYFWGDNAYFGGDNVYFWALSKIHGFWNFFLLLGGGGGGFGTVGRGAP